jgi:hypothetical protein
MDYVRAVYETFRKLTGWLPVLNQNWVCFGHKIKHEINTDNIFLT